jgi:hypothetical protein
VRRETGKEYVVKVHCDEGVAIRVSKRKVDRGEREDRERRNYPPPRRRRIDGAN